jgi:hypothetical protein
VGRSSRIWWFVERRWRVGGDEEEEEEVVVVVVSRGGESDGECDRRALFFGGWPSVLSLVVPLSKTSNELDTDIERS